MNRARSMKRKSSSEDSSFTIQQGVLMAAFFIALAVTLQASQPAWWTASGGPLNNNPANDYAAANMGQFKQFTEKAVIYMDAHVPGGAGTNLENMVTGWSNYYATNGYSSTNPAPGDYAAVNVGQIKYIASQIYGQLSAAGYTGLYPSWIVANTNSDYAVANLGQLKTVFNFDLSVAPPAVTGLSALTGSPGQINLSWTLPSGNNATGITVQESTDGGATWTDVATLGATANSCNVTGLDPSQAYSFRIDSGNAAGTTLSSTTTVLPAAATPVLAVIHANPFQYLVVVTETTPGATIYYTVDGSVPTTGSSTIPSHTQYLLGAGETFKAMAAASGFANSAVATISSTNVVTGGLAAGMYHTVALKNNGTVWTWGLNTSGQLGDGTYTMRGSAVQVASLSGITQVGAGFYHTVALKNDGTVWAWGVNSNGELGDGTTTLRNTPVQVKKSNGSGGATPLTDIVAISVGAYHNLALDGSGNLWAWGLDSSGQLGDGATAQQNLAEQLTTLGGTVSQMVAGAYHSLALTSTGTLEAWGLNSSGQLGDGTTTQRNSPAPIAGIGGTIMTLAAGQYVSFALQNDGSVWGWGAGGGYVGDGTSTQRNSPVHLSTLSNVTEIVSGVNVSLAIKNDGTVWSWGVNNYGERGDGTVAGTPLAPAQMSGIGGAVAIAAGNSASLVVKNDGTIWVCGYNMDGQLGNGDPAQYLSLIQIPTTDTYVSLSANAGHEVFLKGDGTVWGEGDNLYGDNGDGTNLERKTPVQVGGLTGIKAVSAGTYFGLALKNDGSVWGWGWNAYTLGDGTYANRYTSVQTGVGISGFNNMTAVIAGYTEAYSLKDDGTVWGWGDNGHGQMGDGTTTSWLHPAQLASIGGVTALSVGTYHHVLALKSDGTVWAWGFNSSGQLGDGTTTERHSPVQVKLSDGTPLANIVQIRAANNYSMALDSSGHVWTWGANVNGELGDGTTTQRNNPVLLTGIDGVKSIEADKCAVAFAFKTDGTTWAWGPNFHGEFGSGSATGSRSPIQLTNLQGVTHILGTPNNSLMLKEDGYLQAAGWDVYGQMGTCLYAVPFADPGFNILSATPLPAVSITAPANNATVPLGQTATFTAGASESGGSIASISYYMNSNLIGISTSSGSNYSITWTPSTWGAYTFTAIATDANGLTSYRSSPVTVNVPYDSDGNGLPDWWEMQYFGGTGATTGYTTNSSPDGNGLTLLQDYQQGNDPTNYYSQGGTTIVPTVSIVSGNSQTNSPGAFTEMPLVVSVVNSSDGTALTNAPVSFAVTAGGGGLGINWGDLSTTSRSVTTDVSGQAQVYYQSGTGNNISSTIVASSGGQTVSFSSTTTSGDGTFDAPSDMTMTPVSPTQINLTWVNHASSATGIVIDKSTDNVNWTRAATLTDPTTTHYGVTGLTVGQSYYFRIAGSK